MIRRERAPVSEPIIRHMAAALRHRGPDDEGVLIEPGIGLGHTRLAIIDLETGRQPMTDGAVTIVYNGEIYNYVELREQLHRAGYTFETSSDTEVILKLYREYGSDCVLHLNGMFAFVLYDREHHRVVVARDPLGIKPMYWAEIESGWAFASEIKALLRHPEIPAEPDHQALKEYLTFQFVLGGDTLYRGIRQLLPGHLHEFDLHTGAHRVKQYWEPDFVVEAKDEDQFIDEVRYLLQDALRLQIRSDVPLGAYLSGGLDSSTVTILAAGLLDHPIQTFTGAFREGPEFDETGFANIAAEACGAIQHIVYPTEDQFVDLLPRLVYHMDEPAAGPGLFPQFMVSQLAAQHVKVVLGGQGGDEVFGGYARYAVAYFEQALKGAILETNEEGEHIVSLASIIPNLPALQQYVPMLQTFWRKGLFQEMDRRYFQLIDRSGHALSLYSAAFREDLEQEAIFAKFQSVFNHPDTKSYYNKMTHFDLVAGLPALLQVEDRVSMAASLESRVPLLDIRLVNLLTKAPPQLKFRGAALKYTLKRAIRDVVPAAIVDRTDKMGFPVPLHRWRGGRLEELVHDTLLSSTAKSADLIDQDEVRKLMSYEGDFGRRLWGLLNIELWLRECMTPATLDG